MARKKKLTPVVTCWDGLLRTVNNNKYGEAYGLAMRPDGTLIVIPEEEFKSLVNTDSMEEDQQEEKEN